MKVFDFKNNLKKLFINFINILFNFNIFFYIITITINSILKYIILNEIINYKKLIVVN